MMLEGEFDTVINKIGTHPIFSHGFEKWDVSLFFPYPVFQAGPEGEFFEDVEPLSYS